MFDLLRYQRSLQRRRLHHYCLENDVFVPTARWLKPSEIRVIPLTSNKAGCVTRKFLASSPHRAAGAKRLDLSPPVGQCLPAGRIITNLLQFIRSLFRGLFSTNERFEFSIGRLLGLGDIDRHASRHEVW